MKIKISITSGLGNQMFQYAFGKALSVHYDCPLIIDCSYYKQFKSRNYNLNLFDIKESTPDPDPNYIFIEQK